MTISDAALGVLAGGDANYRLRIDGGWEDVLRFDMDDFTEGDAVVERGENHRLFAGTTNSFMADSDVALIDIQLPPGSPVLGRALPRSVGIFHRRLPCSALCRRVSVQNHGAGSFPGNASISAATSTRAH